MKKTVKLVLSLALVAVLGLSLTACFDKDEYHQVAKNEEYSVTYGSRSYSKNIVTDVAPTGDEKGGETVYAGDSSKDYRDQGFYTLNDYTSDMSTLNWNPLTWETADDSAILDYLSSGLYSFVLNGDKTGYSIVPEMASGYPVDVTAEYGKYAYEHELESYFGVTYEEVDITAEEYATASELKHKYEGAQGFQDYFGTTSAAFAAKYEMTEAQLFAALGLEITSVDEFVAYTDIEFESNKAFRIYLNADCCWEDGTKIKAADYIYSMKTLLDPALKNRRADSFYAGSVVLVGAKDYFYQGQEGIGQAELNGTSYADFDKSKLTFVWSSTESSDRTSFLEYMYSNYGSYVGTASYPTLLGLISAGFTGGAAVEAAAGTEATFEAMSGKTLAEIEANTEWKAALDALLGWWCTETDEELMFFEAEYKFAEKSFDTVGYKAGSDENGEYIEFVVTAAVEKPSFNIPYNFSSVPLVKQSLYESLAWESNGVKNNAYQTNGVADSTTGTKGAGAVANSASYGPYKLGAYEDGKSYTLVRNDEWWGYKDGKHYGQYQTDAIKVSVIADHKTALLAFESGDIDSIGLQSEDMEKYGTSSNLRYNPQSYTTKLSFCTDYEKLIARGTNAQLLCLESFRNAFSYAIDQVKFATSYTSAGQGGFGLLNRLYVYDPIQGSVYRDTDPAMEAIVSLYGVEYGAGKEYKTLKEAYDAITGYDIEQARSLMAKAYEEAVAAGLWNDEAKKATFVMGVYTEDDIYVNMFNFLNTALQEACKGTGFEGKVSLIMKVDADYYESMYAGNLDIIFTTWGGAAARPFEVFYECYCDAADGSGNQMEVGFDTSAIQVTMVIDGETYTTNLQKWALWADGDKDTTISNQNGSLEAFKYYGYATRCAIFANLENAYLSFGVTIPLYYRNSALLVSAKGDYAVQAYVDTIGFGGIQFYTYNYTDEQWASVKGSLDYTK